MTGLITLLAFFGFFLAVQICFKVSIIVGFILVVIVGIGQLILLKLFTS